MPQKICICLMHSQNHIIQSPLIFTKFNEVRVLNAVELIQMMYIKILIGRYLQAVHSQ